jgi:hypothetical protein
MSDVISNLSSVLYRHSIQSFSEALIIFELHAKIDLAAREASQTGNDVINRYNEHGILIVFNDMGSISSGLEVVEGFPFTSNGGHVKSTAGGVANRKLRHLRILDRSRLLFVKICVLLLLLGSYWHLKMGGNARSAANGLPRPEVVVPIDCPNQLYVNRQY